MSIEQETTHERRKRRLEWLAKQYTVDWVAQQAGVSMEGLLQIIRGVLLPPKADGSRSPRSVGDKLARAIEDGLNLGRGWFDQPGDQNLGAPALRRTIAENVKGLLEARWPGEGLAGLEGATGIPATLLHRVLTADPEINLEHLEILAKAFGLQPALLLLPNMTPQTLIALELQRLYEESDRRLTELHQRAEELRQEREEIDRRIAELTPPQGQR